MKAFRGLSLSAKVAVIAGVLGTTGAAAATGVVVLPSHANTHAKNATLNVRTGQPSAAPSESGTPAPQASFGQCVANNAKTASTDHAQGWNPTQGCTKPGAAGGANTAPGLTTAGQHANPAASPGLSHAAAGAGNAVNP
jgi:hypothetical protein